MATLPKPLQNAIDEISKLPGIGPKSAQRMVFYLVRRDRKVSEDLGDAIFKLKNSIVLCRICQNIADHELCQICEDDTRDQTTLCVVEDPLDIIAFEQPSVYRGVYHVLHGAISPVDGIGPDELMITQLLDRLKAPDSEIKEVILATNPTTEGEATALYLNRLLGELGLSITRIARGIPFGGDIEYADPVTLAKSLEGRMKY